jgi:hypothetical protein
LAIARRRPARRIEVLERLRGTPMILQRLIGTWGDYAVGALEIRGAGRNARLR